MSMRYFSLLAACVVASSARGQSAKPAAESSTPKPIQDNSFLLEEAYNQEPAVIQHINTVFFDRAIHTWLYALTDEWPVISQRHQLSVTIPLENGSQTSPLLGDIAVNYRLQLIGSGDTRLAVTPRLTVLLPTADEALGAGSTAFQGALASSYMATPKLALHSNARGSESKGKPF